MYIDWVADRMRKSGIGKTILEKICRGLREGYDDGKNVRWFLYAEDYTKRITANEPLIQPVRNIKKSI